MTAKERERAFFIGAPLAIVPALVFLPAVTFLLIFPRITHGRVMGLFALPACALTSFFGLWKLAIGAVQKPSGNLQCSQFRGLAGFTGNCRLYGTVFSTNDVKTLTSSTLPASNHEDSLKMCRLGKGIIRSWALLGGNK